MSTKALSHTLGVTKPLHIPAGKTLEVRRSEAADAKGKATTPEQLRRIFYTAVEDRRRATVGLRPLPKPAPPPAPPSEERTKEILADDRVQVGQQSTLCCMLACAWVMCCRCSHLAYAWVMCCRCSHVAVVWLMTCPRGLSVVLYKSAAAHQLHCCRTAARHPHSNTRPSCYVDQLAACFSSCTCFACLLMGVWLSSLPVLCRQ